MTFGITASLGIIASLVSSSGFGDTLPSLIRAEYFCHSECLAGSFIELILRHLFHFGDYFLDYGTNLIILRFNHLMSSVFARKMIRTA